MGRFHRYAYQQVASDDLVLPLLIIAFQSGLLDATTAADFRTFASNQTGNVVFLTVGVANAAVINMRNTGSSLGSYLLSGFIGGRVGWAVGHRQRLWLIITNVLQTLLLVTVYVLICTNILQVGNIQHQWILILLFGSSAGFQVAVARNVGVSEVPTAMLSSPLIDLITDPNLFKLECTHSQMRTRNRRIAYVVSIVSGSFVGAFIQRYNGTNPVVLLGVILKAIVTIWIACLPGLRDASMIESPAESNGCIEEPSRELRYT